MIHPRWLARTIAAIRSNWWLPCPVCGQGFAAFESSDHGLMSPDCASERDVCRRCEQYAIRHNRDLMRENKAAGRDHCPGYLEEKYAYIDHGRCICNAVEFHPRRDRPSMVDVMCIDPPQPFWLGEIPLQAILDFADTIREGRYEDPWQREALLNSALATSHPLVGNAKTPPG